MSEASEALKARMKLSVTEEIRFLQSRKREMKARKYKIESTLRRTNYCEENLLKESNKKGGRTRVKSLILKTFFTAKSTSLLRSQFSPCLKNVRAPDHHGPTSYSNMMSQKKKFLFLQKLKWQESVFGLLKYFLIYFLFCRASSSKVQAGFSCVSGPCLNGICIDDFNR